MITRRDFLKIMGMMGMVVIAPVRRLNLFLPQKIEQEIIGDLYAGFLILPDGAPVPSIVKAPQLGFPNECGVGIISDVPDHSFTTQEFRTLEEFIRDTKLSVYFLEELPKDMRLGSISGIKPINGNVYLVSLGYEAHLADTDIWQCTIWLLAQMDFPRPVPIWYSNPVEPNGPAVIPEKVDFLPTPGILVKTQNGCVCHWIDNDILFTLVIQDFQEDFDVQAIAKKLTK